MNKFTQIILFLSLILPILLFGEIPCSKPFEFSDGKTQVLDKQSTSTKNSSQLTSAEIFIKSPALTRVFKFADAMAQFSWQCSRREQSSFKDLFAIYNSQMAARFLDPRLPILASRAHPPTLIS